MGDRSLEWGKPAYDAWVEQEGVPVLRGLHVPDLATVPVAYWPRKAVNGTFVKLLGSENVNDAYVVEIPPGASENAEQHFFEEFIFILKGRGAIELWNDSHDTAMFEWSRGSVFAIPLNVHHRMHNNSGVEAVRYLAVTSAPLYMNLIHDQNFIFQCPYDFRDRFRGQDDYADEGEWRTQRIWETNFLPDVYTFGLNEWADRGAGGKNTMLEIQDSTMGAHISEFPVGTYKKAHRHAAGSHVIILSGQGYSLMWEAGQEVQRVDWQSGSMLVPPNMWYHQHFNVGDRPARYLALRANSMKHPALRNPERLADQIEYEEQEPWVHQQFLEACAKNGVVAHMEAFIPSGR